MGNNGITHSFQIFKSKFPGEMQPEQNQANPRTGVAACLYQKAEMEK